MCSTNAKSLLFPKYFVTETIGFKNMKFQLDDHFNECKSLFSSKRVIEDNRGAFAQLYLIHVLVGERRTCLEDLFFPVTGFSGSWVCLQRVGYSKEAFRKREERNRSVVCLVVHILNDILHNSSANPLAGLFNALLTSLS